MRKCVQCVSRGLRQVRVRDVVPGKCVCEPGVRTAESVPNNHAPSHVISCPFHSGGCLAGGGSEWWVATRKMRARSALSESRKVEYCSTRARHNRGSTIACVRVACRPGLESSRAYRRGEEAFLGTRRSACGVR